MEWLTARYLYLFVSILYYLKNSSAQQNELISQPNLNNPIGPSISNGPIIQKSLNQIPKCSKHQTNLQNLHRNGNSQQSANLQHQLNLQQAALQQQYNLQQLANLQQAANIQQVANFQQAENPQQMNIQQGNIPQISLQNEMNLQQHSGLPQMNFQIPANMQPMNFQQSPQFQQLNFHQPTNFPSGSTNLQAANHQASPLRFTNSQLGNHPASNNPLSSAPFMNGQISGLNPQSLYQASDPSVLSAVAPSVTNFNIHPQPGADVLFSGYSQNNPITNTHSMMDLSQTLNTGSPFSQSPGSGTYNNQQYALVALPLQNVQSRDALPMNGNQIPNSPNQVTIIRSTQPQMPNDLMQNQIEPDQNQFALLSSLFPEMPATQYSPISTTSPISNNQILSAALSKQGSKSNFNALLPLIFNLLKEKNNGCGCHNCGCAKNKQEPQVFSGYAKQNSYGPGDRTSATSNDVYDDFDDNDQPHNSQNKPKQVKQNMISSNSGEYDSDPEYVDSYDDED